MKVVLNNKKAAGLLNRAPIGFWDFAEEDPTIKKQSHDDDICHDVKYDHTQRRVVLTSSI